MSQQLVTLRQMQTGVGVITALSLGLTIPGMADSGIVASPEIQMSEMGEKAYELALVSNWKEAKQLANQIEAASSQLPADQIGLRNRFGLFKAIYHYENAIALQDKWEAAWAANRITLFATRLTRLFPRKFPLEVALLDVYSRELQVAGARHDEVAAHRAIGSLHANWRTIRPQLLKVSGTNSLAQRFDRLLQRVGGAPDVKEMGKQATLILNQIDNVKQTLTR